MLQEKINFIPKPEQNYITNLKASDIALTLEKPFEEYSHCKKYLSILKSIVIEYDKAIDKLMDIDIECYPESYDSQEEVCSSLVRLYYKVKDELYSYLSHLDIYNADLPGMSSRNGMISVKGL